mgnify:CR=1 FL=1
MSEIITQTRIEDAVANTEAFLSAQRGAGLDGQFAAAQLAERTLSMQQRAQELLQSVPHPKFDGLYVPLSSYNAGRYDEAASVLPGHLVLVPSSLVEQGPSAFYPAVVSEDGLKTQSLRLHVLRQPYRQHISYGAGMVLSGAGQSETPGIGDHGRTSHDGVEAEHFATLLTAGADPTVRAAWQAGQHVNHAWRQQSGNSVTAELSGRLFGSDIPQTTVTVSREDIARGRAVLFWHEGLRDQATGQPETAARHNGLVVMQSLGFEALRSQHAPGLNTVKELLA